MQTEQEVFRLCDVVREASYALHRYLRHGHLEKVYENGLANRLRKAGLRVEQQYRLEVQDQDGTVLGDYLADLFIKKRLVVELKAGRDVCAEHVAQLLGYLRSSRIEHGLLINFGAPRLQIKKIRPFGRVASVSLRFLCLFAAIDLLPAIDLISILRDLTWLRKL